jgi:transposase
LSPELQSALEPLLAEIECLSEHIAEYNDRIEALAQTSYPQVELLKQIKGVGTLIALTYLLTLEDPHRFRKSRDVGCYLGLQPGRRNSGRSEPQLHISKAIPICARYWCRERSTFWDRSVSTAICDAGA